MRESDGALMLFPTHPATLFSNPDPLPVLCTLRNAVDYSRISAGDIIWRNKDPALDSRMKAYMDKGDTQASRTSVTVTVIFAFTHTFIVTLTVEVAVLSKPLNKSISPALSYPILLHFPSLLTSSCTLLPRKKNFHRHTDTDMYTDTVTYTDMYTDTVTYADMYTDIYTDMYTDIHVH